MKINEEMTIWSNKNYTKLDDADTIKSILKEKLNDKFVSLDKVKLLKDMEDIKVYKVTYTYKDMSINSKNNVHNI